MAREPQAFDRQPGSLPDIRTSNGSLTFVCSVAGLQKGAQLVIRCDADGEIWISITPDIAGSA